MKTQIFPGDFSSQDFYQLVIGSIGPRPIALISTTDDDGVNNLAPYSFFNIFSVHPPIVAFSTSLKSQPNHEKDTLKNVRESGECVINVVSSDIMHQMVMTAADYPSDVDEFTKAGFTPIKSQLVTPPAVMESKANLECKVSQIIELGTPPTGYLVICNVVRMVVNDEVIENNRINPEAMGLIGRLGRNYYSRTDTNARLEIPRPMGHLPIGFDGLPDFIKFNEILTGKELYEFAIREKFDVDDTRLPIRDYNVSELEFINNKVRPLINIDINKAYSLLLHYYNGEQ